MALTMERFIRWLAEENIRLYDSNLGEEWLDIQDDKRIWELVNKISDEELWEIKKLNKIRLFNYIQEIVRKRWVEDRIDPTVAIAEGILLDPDVLTIGFARRFTGYKRPPADLEGKRILQKIFRYAHDPAFSGRIAFVEDYGEFLAKHMVHGVDVWLNNPLPPLEASGTSGMKAGINGTIHLSIADGWWVEGYNGKNGWIFGQNEIQGDRTKKIG